jgi:DNA ligase-associated metallophosphoesterase
MITEDALLAKLDARTACLINFAGHRFILDASGALVWPKHDMVVFSDLHFEKGSFLSQFANPLPRFDTAKTITNMQNVLQEYSPKQVICLGDSLHDGNALSRMNNSDLSDINDLVRGVDAWFWVLGNHDPEIPDAILGQSSEYYELDNILWVHEPENLTRFANVKAQVIGHFHPKLSVKKARHRMTGKCFVSTENILLMPAFGQYTGGLWVEDEAIQSLLQGPYQTHLLFNNKLYSTGIKA